MKRILGIDYGVKRIGIACSDPLGLIASPVGTYHSRGMRDDVDYLTSEAKKRDCGLIVLGLPLNMDGSEGKKAQLTRRLGEILQKASGLEVVLKDERLTTVSAHRVLDEGGVGFDKRSVVIDTLSAQLILQSYLDEIKILNSGDDHGRKEQ